MKKLFAFLLLALVCIPSFSRQTTVRIGSYNLRMQQMDKGENDWSEFRRERVIRSIRDNQFDIFGVQELTDFAQEDLRKHLGDTYGFIFFSPYSQDGIGTKAQGILYRKDRFELCDSKFFWYSDGDPTLMTENDHYFTNGKEHAFKRGFLYAIFRDRKTGKKLFFMNNHGILNKGENLRYAYEHVEIERKYNPDCLPSFFVGDFNARRSDNPSHQVYRCYWKDAADTVQELPVTFNGFNPDPSKWNPQAHIDFIYYRNVDNPARYECNQTLYDGHFASDHFPIWADFEI